MTTGPTSDRTQAIKTALKAEAERRARSGEPLSHIARALDISNATINRWAARGRFRQIDRRRQARGLAPLPVPRWARPDYSAERRKETGREFGPKADQDAAAPHTPDAAASPLSPAPDLKTEARLLALEALALVRAGQLKNADDKLRAADRLLRIDKRLHGTTPPAPPEPSKSEAARARVLAMSDTELEAEIMRLAGVSGN